MIKIRDKELDFPLIQGGMGVGISLGNLAGSVMLQGCMGVISSAHTGYRKDNFFKNSMKLNKEAIFEEVDKARKISKGKGLLGVNVMCAIQGYKEYVKTCIDAHVDAIISGAGLPLDLPSYRDNNVLLAPIVSSSKATNLICKVWDKRYNCIPDFIVIESSRAGGHLGFKLDDLLNNTCESLESIVKSVREIVKPFEEKYNYRIPIFAAGGVFTGKDMARLVSLGADGVQMGTRFIATDECDADIKYKQAIVDCKKSDISLVKSPTGFPGRAILNKFVKHTRMTGNVSVSKCFRCLIPCNPLDTPYCISLALINAAKGDLDNGLIFCSENAYRVDKIVSVKELIDEIKKDFNEEKL